ncbi:MAG: hypothetical protein QGF74_02075 [Candidatus Nanoarchaeia archaeon]|mgnify:CR=1 FL=1|jgi:hypothetical protein|nr:hypothetical protein [Candidatus Nanoarchaeia archaeon]|tara:strand:- start:53420 stop:53746 length:327 start_codon:yes stop_codon:yes gene_type:complete
MINEILFGIDIMSFILIIIAIFLMIKSKKFEKKENIKEVLNLVLIGLFFITIVIAFDLSSSLNIFESISSKLEIIPFDLFYLGIELMIIPIAALSFLVGLMHLRESNQ